MTPDLKKNFVTWYLESLLERTRQENSGTKWGLDWVVYSLGLALFGKPVRLPFRRTSQEDYSMSKSEAEFGVDLSFLSEDQKTLTVFVLKDEPLTISTWTKNKFLNDMETAKYPELGDKHFCKVTQLTVVLAYNKDEDANGVTAYERFVKNAPPKVWRNKVRLRFERWNLSDLADLTLKHLLTPSLVPQKFFGQLDYLCAQAADFAHGSDPWENQLLPAWKRFLDDVLKEGTGERGVALVPVALIILRQRAEANPTIATGLIDLTEWAAIVLWRFTLTSTGKKIRQAVFRFWLHFYVIGSRNFYVSQMPLLAEKHSIDQLASRGFIAPVAASYVGYWHLARLGLLSMAFSELGTSKTDAGRKEQQEILQQVSDWIEALVKANVCVFRPLLDIHHIEIFLTIAAWIRTGRMQAAFDFLGELERRLYVRRFGKARDLPFLDGCNSLENVFEQIALKPKEQVVSTGSSFLLLMLLELCCVFDSAARGHLLRRIHMHLVLGAADDGRRDDYRPVDLISWIAPGDWDEKVLRGYVGDGEAVSIPPLSDSADTPDADLYSTLKDLIGQMSKASKLKFEHEIPASALILASMRHQSPLPPEFWRAGFGISSGETASQKAMPGEHHAP
ncbi:MAG: hypothetical protein LBK99_00150 [Opitutaceae bacterium]|jgi:hypothetical protein|nr:hypothetical protein [Opitutaceae bacterium]